MVGDPLQHRASTLPDAAPHCSRVYCTCLYHIRLSLCTHSFVCKSIKDQLSDCCLFLFSFCMAALLTDTNKNNLWHPVMDHLDTNPDAQDCQCVQSCTLTASSVAAVAAVTKLSSLCLQLHQVPIVACSCFMVLTLYACAPDGHQQGQLVASGGGQPGQQFRHTLHGLRPMP